MANEAEDLIDLRRRVEALENLVLALGGRIESLESAAANQDPDFHLPDDEPTV